jgi:hypothetical protein
MYGDFVRGCHRDTTQAKVACHSRSEMMFRFKAVAEALCMSERAAYIVNPLQLVPLSLEVCGQLLLVGVDVVLLGLDLVRSDAVAVTVAVEQNVLGITLGAVVGLDPLAPAGSLVDGAEEAQAAVLDVGTVVLAHNGLDGLGGLIGVVEGDGGDVVVEDVGLDDAVEDLATDEAELAVNGCGGATGEVPGLAAVVGEGWVGVLEVGDGDCGKICQRLLRGKRITDRECLPSQWWTQNQGTMYQTKTAWKP